MIIKKGSPRWLGKQNEHHGCCLISVSFFLNSVCPSVSTKIFQWLLLYDLGSSLSDGFSACSIRRVR